MSNLQYTLALNNTNSNRSYMKYRNVHKINPYTKPAHLYLFILTVKANTIPLWRRQKCISANTVHLQLN